MVTAVSTDNAAGRVATGTGMLASNFETFLTLLTSQLRNQDPLSPVDSNQFTAQLTQMAGVEQQLLTNDLLKGLLEAQGGAGLSGAANYIGREATAAWSATKFTEGEATWSYELAANADTATLQVLDSKGKVVALDAKFNFDSNALFRHPEIVALRDLDEEDAAEVEASKFDLAYISLDGNIGCLVNGAGLAMATMDTIKLFGGEPANFLDVGGGATAEKVTEAFKIMLKNPEVKGILVNIFGGIMKCDTIAEGVITACKAVNLSVPLVVRMKGTNEDLGKKMLADSGLPIIAADTMEDAAKAVVAAAAGNA